MFAINLRQLERNLAFDFLFLFLALVVRQDVTGEDEGPFLPAPDHVGVLLGRADFDYCIFLGQVINIEEVLVLLEGLPRLLLRVITHLCLVKALLLLQHMRLW